MCYNLHMSNDIRHDFIINKGATFSKEIRYKDENGALINLTGYVARMHIRETVESSTTIVTLTTENGRITLGGAAGTIVLNISATDTAAITQNLAVYDLEIVAGGGLVTRLLEGEVQFIDNVTR